MPPLSASPGRARVGRSWLQTIERRGGAGRGSTGTVPGPVQRSGADPAGLPGAVSAALPGPEPGVAPGAPAEEGPVRAQRIPSTGARPARGQRASAGAWMEGRTDGWMEREAGTDARSPPLSPRIPARCGAGINPGLGAAAGAAAPPAPEAAHRR